MGSKSGKVISTAFPAGATVKLYDRDTDFFEPAVLGKPEASAKVDKHSEVTFSSLEPGTPYWVVHEDSDGNVTHRRALAKDPDDPSAAWRGPSKARDPGEVRDALREAAVEGGNKEPAIEGARTTANANPEVDRTPEGDLDIPVVDDPSSPPYDTREPGSKSARSLSDQGTSEVKDEEERTPHYREKVNPTPQAPLDDDLKDGATDKGEPLVPDGFIDDADGGIRPEDRDPDEVPDDPLDAEHVEKARKDRERRERASSKPDPARSAAAKKAAATRKRNEAKIAKQPTPPK